MTKLTNRALSLILAFAIALSVVAFTPMTAHAAEPSLSTSISYDNSGGRDRLVLSGYLSTYGDYYEPNYYGFDIYRDGSYVGSTGDSSRTVWYKGNNTPTNMYFDYPSPGRYTAYIYVKYDGSSTKHYGGESGSATVTAQTYTVSYNSNGGSGAPSSQTKTKGQTLYLSSTTPSRSGYTFAGWSTSSSSSYAQYQSGDSFTTDANTTLYAVWSQSEPSISTSISYDNSNGNNRLVLSGYLNSYGSYWEPNYYGFDIYRDGSYVGSTGDSSRTVWSKNNYTPTNMYYDNPSAGRYTAKIYVKYDGSSTKHYGSDSGSVTVATQTYTISYNANGGSGAPSSQTKTKGQTLYLSSATPSRSGYTFAGWSTSSGASYAQYQAGEAFTTDANTTLYAVWSQSEPSVSTSISYDNSNGNNRLVLSGYLSTYGSYWEPNYYGFDIYRDGSYVGTTGDSSRTVWSKNNYTPTSMYYDNSAAGKYTAKIYVKYDGSSTKHYGSESSSVTVATQTYTINYNANGGSGAPSSQTKTKGQTLYLSSTAPTRSGYTFVGWSTSSGSSTAQYQPNGSFTADANTTLYAVWSQSEPSISTSISYDNANGNNRLVLSGYLSAYGSYWEPNYYGFDIYRDGSYVGTTGDSSRTVWSKNNYTPASMYYDNPAAGKYTAKIYVKYDGSSTKHYGSESSSITVATQTYTISYNANGGNGAPASQTKTKGQTLTLASATPTRSGWSFVGWATTSGATTAQYQPNGAFTTDANTTLYAVWSQSEPSISTSISYDSSNGNNRLVLSGYLSTYGSYEAPNYYGFDIYRDGSYVGATGDSTRTVWSKGNSTPANMYYDNPAAGKYTAKIYVKYDGSSVKHYGSESSSITVAAQTYTISYNANGGTGAPASQTKTKGQTLYITSSTPTRSGWAFIGWATTSSSTTAQYQSNDAFTTDANTTLYAIWSQSEPSIITSISWDNANGNNRLALSGYLNAYGSYWEPNYYGFDIYRDGAYVGTTGDSTRAVWTKGSNTPTKMYFDNPTAGKYTAKIYVKYDGSSVKHYGSESSSVTVTAINDAITFESFSSNYTINVGDTLKISNGSVKSANSNLTVVSVGVIDKNTRAEFITPQEGYRNTSVSGKTFAFSNTAINRTNTLPAGEYILRINAANATVNTSDNGTTKEIPFKVSAGSLSGKITTDGKEYTINKDTVKATITVSSAVKSWEIYWLKDGNKADIATKQKSSPQNQSFDCGKVSSPNYNGVVLYGYDNDSYSGTPVELGRDTFVASYGSDKITLANMVSDEITKGQTFTFGSKFDSAVVQSDSSALTKVTVSLRYSGGGDTGISTEVWRDGKKANIGGYTLKTSNLPVGKYEFTVWAKNSTYNDTTGALELCQGKYTLTIKEAEKGVPGFSAGYNFWLQTDDRWASVDYSYGGNGRDISYSGCGILSVINALYNLNGMYIPVSELAKYSKDVGGRVDDGTALSTLVPKTASKYGFKYDGTTTSPSEAAKHINAGGKAIASVDNHIVAIVGARNDALLVYDSAPTDSRGTKGNADGTWVSYSTFTAASGKLSIKKGDKNGFYLLSSNGTSKQPSLSLNFRSRESRISPATRREASLKKPYRSLSSTRLTG